MAASALLGAMALAPAARAQPALEGEYRLVSSSTAPVGTWLYTKGRLAITRLDERHLLIRLACEWKRSPASGCDDWWTVQVRGGGLYLQDRNTDNITLQVDSARRTITMQTQAYDAAGTMRTDVFQADAQPTADSALIRRMKRAQSGFEGTWKHKAFGHYSKWDYTRAQMPFSGAR